MKPDKEWLRYIRKMLCKDKCFMMEEKTQKEIAALIDSALSEPSDAVEHGVVAKECIERYKADPQKAVEQTEWCGYECEGGSIEKNLAWAAIKELLAEPSAVVAVSPVLDEFMDALFHCDTVKVILTGCGETTFSTKEIHQSIHALRQYQKPTDEKIRQAIEWQSCLKDHHQHEWEGTDIDWQMEPGAQAEHDEMMQAFDLAIQALRQYQKPSGSTSDGYHTFDELYHHRAVLFSALCYAYKDKAWRAKKHHDGSMFGDDWFICGVETPQGQYTYHYRISECWDLFDFCKTLDNAPEWDGHQPKDVDRLLSLRQMRSEPDCSTAEWQGGYCLGYGKSDTDDEPCDVCKSCPKQASYADDKCEWCDKTLTLFTNSGKYIPENQPPRNYCPNCGRKLVKQDG